MGDRLAKLIVPPLFWSTNVGVIIIWSSITAWIIGAAKAIVA